MRLRIDIEDDEPQGIIDQLTLLHAAAGIIYTDISPPPTSIRWVTNDSSYRREKRAEITD